MKNKKNPPNIAYSKQISGIQHKKNSLCKSFGIQQKNDLDPYLNMVIENITNGVLVFDKNKKIIVTNPAMRKIIQLKNKKVTLFDFIKIFKGVIQLIGEKKREIDISKDINKVLSSVKIVYYKETQLKDRFFEIFIVPIQNHRKKVLGGAIILHNITTIKKLEKMRTDFVSVASHQLRTPLTAMKLFGELIISKGFKKLDARQKEYLEYLFQSTHQMIELVNDLLNVSLIEAGKLKIEPKPTQMEHLIQKTINEIMPIVKDRKCKIAFQKPRKKIPKILVDQRLICQIIRNLITNAVRYSPTVKGNILVKLEKRNKEEYLISIKDNGIGISKEAQSRIFEKFYRADNAIKSVTEGSGLGLYTSKMIIEASGGKIWFKSKPNKGTIFYLTIPTKGMSRKKGEKGVTNE